MSSMKCWDVKAFRPSDSTDRWSQAGQRHRQWGLSPSFCIFTGVKWGALASQVLKGPRRDVTKRLTNENKNHYFFGAYYGPDSGLCTLVLIPFFSWPTYLQILCRCGNLSLREVKSFSCSHTSSNWRNCGSNPRVTPNIYSLDYFIWGWEKGKEWNRDGRSGWRRGKGHHLETSVLRGWRGEGGAVRTEA